MAEAGRRPGRGDEAKASARDPLRPRLFRFGVSRAPVVVIDGFSGDVRPIVDLASALAPFPPARNFYPGLRRVVTKADGAAYAYVRRSLQATTPFINAVFGANRFDLLEASFSMVTHKPEGLAPPQRAPHFDSTDPNYLAVLHYLSGTPGSGTAFYRQRSSDIERVSPASAERFIALAKQESAGLSGYIGNANPDFEQIGRVDALADRLIIYQGCLLHSGIIPEGMSFSADPRAGRLTGNFFVRAVPSASPA